MKRFCLFFCFAMTIGFADTIMLKNQTSYPNAKQQSKIAVQWASSAKEVNLENQALIQGSPLNPSTLQGVKKSGDNLLHVPKQAEYFRVIAWSKGEGEPDLHTNWVEIVPNKTYLLETDHLIPSVLMLGMGC